MEDNIVQFCSVTSASVRDARKFLEKYKRMDVAVDAYFNDPNALASPAKYHSTSVPSTSKLHALFEVYKDPDGTDIGIDGTIKLCEDLKVRPEDVVLLAVAYELKSPSMGQWTKAGWTDGWKGLGCDNLEAMKAALPKLRQRLSSDPTYFRKVYTYTFQFSLAEGQRVLPKDTAQAFWALLIPEGLRGGALSHTDSTETDSDNDVSMSDSSEGGWKPDYTDWWIEFMGEQPAKGVSKDTWNMFIDFVRTIDEKFEKYDEEGSWPSVIDDFVQYARNRLASGA